MPNSNTDPSYNVSRDPRAPQAAGYPIINQPHTTGTSATPAPAQFTGWGHPERDPRMISYSGTDGMGAPAPLSKPTSDPRDNGGQGQSKVTYNNQAPAPQTF
jgi:hypothetical protein